MKCFIGLGSNLGERRSNLERAAQALFSKTRVKPRVSPIVETPALVPDGAPLDWRKPFLNGVLEIEWSGSPRELLQFLKTLEVNEGRRATERWAPRTIDLDLLTFGTETTQEDGLLVPHPETWNRQFVLAPLKHLQPDLRISTQKQTALERSRSLKGPIPLWMGVLNLTPDSFSDGGLLDSAAALAQRLDEFDEQNIQILDLGAESTRPGADRLTAGQEWARIVPALEIVIEKFKDRLFCPMFSIDTYHPENAKRAVDLGVQFVNDVSGLDSPEMLELLQATAIQYVLMHSLSVPADPKANLRTDRPVQEVKEWLTRKLDQLDRKGIELNRIIFDPGIGFGKTAVQSFALLQEIEQFLDLPVRLLVGHSRKSFLNQWGIREAKERDTESVGVSLSLAERGIDILRVHRPDLHHRAFRAFRGVG